MTGLTGSLCSGYAGLDLAAHAVLGGQLAWTADNDRGAAAILACRFPGVPNHGDLTAVDWASVEPVDVLTAGFPCQPVSAAGQRRGTADERWLFDDIAAAVGRMDPRPRLLVLENVTGLLTANSGAAMGRVVPGLAALGYVGRYRTLRASDVGAPHRRERVFIVAWPAADAADCRRNALDDGGEPGADGSQPGSWRPSVARDNRGSRLTVADAASGGRDEGRPESARLQRRPAAAERGHGPAADAERDRLARALQQGRRSIGRDALARCGADAAANAASERRPRPQQPCPDLEHDRPEPAHPGAHGRAWRATADASSARLREQPRNAPAQETRPLAGDQPAGDRRPRPAIDWGPYQPAIARWEHVTGRPAPRPTEPGRSGQRLSPRFVEWLMGLPAGWVTDVPGLTRNAQLKALGNGVVPQQAAMALRLLLAPAGGDLG